MIEVLGSQPIKFLTFEQSAIPAKCASPRTGSTSLTTAIGNTYGITKYNEPFNPRNENLKWDDSLFDIPHVLKTMIYDIDIKSFNFDIYDKIIYLTRRDLLELAQSFTYAISRYKFDWRKWTEPYTLPKSDRPTWHSKWVNDIDKELKDIADTVTYYEDLFSRDKETVYKSLQEIDMVDKFDTLFAELLAKNRYRNYKRTII